MGRKIKKGFDYFPLDTDIFSNTKIIILKSEFGSPGIELYIYLLCEIYKKGYYIPINSDTIYVISYRLNSDKKTVEKMIEFMVEKNLFCKQIFEENNVLTSSNIQLQFKDMVVSCKRKCAFSELDFWILNDDKTDIELQKQFKVEVKKSEEKTAENYLFGKNSEEMAINSEEMAINSEEMAINSEFSTQSKVKESKVNKKEIEKEKNLYKFNSSSFFKNPELLESFNGYLLTRNNISDIQKKALADELKSLSENEDELLTICRKATASKWKSFYKPKKEYKPKTGFQNFKGRGITEDVEKKLIRKDIEWTE